MNAYARGETSVNQIDDPDRFPAYNVMAAQALLNACVACETSDRGKRAKARTGLIRYLTELKPHLDQLDENAIPGCALRKVRRGVAAVRKGRGGGRGRGDGMGGWLSGMLDPRNQRVDIEKRGGGLSKTSLFKFFFPFSKSQS